MRSIVQTICVSLLTLVSTGVNADVCGNKELKYEKSVHAPTRRSDAILGMKLHPGERLSASILGSVDINRKWWQEEVCSKVFGIKIKWTCEDVWRTKGYPRSPDRANVGVTIGSANSVPALLRNNQTYVPQRVDHLPTQIRQGAVWVLNQRDNNIALRSNLDQFNDSYNINVALAEKLINGDEGISRGDCRNKPSRCSAGAYQLQLAVDVSQRVSDFVTWLGQSSREVDEIRDALNSNLGWASDDDQLKMVEALLFHYEANYEGSDVYSDSLALLDLIDRQIGAGPRTNGARICEESLDSRNFIANVSEKRATALIKSGQITEGLKVAQTAVEEFRADLAKGTTVNFTSYLNGVNNLHAIALGNQENRQALNAIDVRSAIWALQEAREMLREGLLKFPNAFKGDDLKADGARRSFVHNSIAQARLLQRMGTRPALKEASEKYEDAQELLPIERNSLRLLAYNHNSNVALVGQPRSSVLANSLSDVELCQSQLVDQAKRLASGMIGVINNAKARFYDNACKAQSCSHSLEPGDQLLDGNCEVGAIVENEDEIVVRHDSKGESVFKKQYAVALNESIDDLEVDKDHYIIKILPIYETGKFLCATSDGIRNPEASTDSESGSSHYCGELIDGLPVLHNVIVSQNGKWLIGSDSSGDSIETRIWSLENPRLSEKLEFNDFQDASTAEIVAFSEDKFALRLNSKLKILAATLGDNNTLQVADHNAQNLPVDGTLFAANEALLITENTEMLSNYTVVKPTDQADIWQVSKRELIDGFSSRRTFPQIVEGKEELATKATLVNSVFMLEFPLLEKINFNSNLYFSAYEPGAVEFLADHLVVRRLGQTNTIFGACGVGEQRRVVNSEQGYGQSIRVEIPGYKDRWAVVNQGSDGSILLQGRDCTQPADLNMVIAKAGTSWPWSKLPLVANTSVLRNGKLTILRPPNSEKLYEQALLQTDNLALRLDFGDEKLSVTEVERFESGDVELGYFGGLISTSSGEVSIGNDTIETSRFVPAKAIRFNSQRSEALALYSDGYVRLVKNSSGWESAADCINEVNSDPKCLANVSDDDLSKTSSSRRIPIARNTVRSVSKRNKDSLDEHLSMELISDEIVSVDDCHILTSPSQDKLAFYPVQNEFCQATTNEIAGVSDSQNR